MKGYVDLHCHWVAGIDDGVRSEAEGVELLVELHAVGFDMVVATPHMRPGMFDNCREDIERAFSRMSASVERATRPLPERLLASEHFLDDTVFGRLTAGEGLPYPALGPMKRRGALVELSPRAFPARLANRFFDLARSGLRPVLAHPERYQPVWNDDRCLDELLDAGAALLLDVCALVGKYGRAAQHAAESLLEEDGYEAACSDAHRPADAEVTARAIDRLRELVGDAECQRLLVTGPRALLGLDAANATASTRNTD